MIAAGLRLRLAAGHAAPAALRPVHAARLEGAAADQPGLASTRASTRRSPRASAASCTQRLLREWEEASPGAAGRQAIVLAGPPGAGKSSSQKALIDATGIPGGGLADRQQRRLQGPAPARLARRRQLRARHPAAGGGGVRRARVAARARAAGPRGGGHAGRRGAQARDPRGLERRHRRHTVVGAGRQRADARARPRRATASGSPWSTRRRTSSRRASSTAGAATISPRRTARRPIR